MSNRIKGLVALAGLLFLAGNAGNVAAEDYRIGYVNTARILAESNAAKQVQTKLEGQFAKRDGELKKLQTKVQELQTRLDKEGATMSETARRSSERDLADTSRDYQRQYREFREDLIAARNEELGKLQDLANKAIQKIAETQKFDLIVQEPIVYASKRIDITEQVIKTLDATK